MDIDCGKVEFPDELPSLPNEDRLLVQVSEKLHQHEVSCLDMVDLPHSPDSSNLTPQKPSIIEAIRYTHVEMMFVCSVRIPCSVFVTVYECVLYSVFVTV